LALLSPLVKRLSVSAVIGAAVIYLIFFAPLWVYFIGLEFVILATLNEFFTMAKQKGLPVHKPIGLLFGALIPLNYFISAEPLFILLLILSCFLVGFDRKAPTQSESLGLTAMTFFGVIYIGWLISFFLDLHEIPETGHWWVFFVIFVVKMGDAAAYFVGKKWGQHKLLPHVSPEKSVEGALGSLGMSIICSLICKIILPSVPMFHLLILGITLSLLAQLGDLVESLIKRNLGAKDSGTLPGLGGMLDIMDSLLFAAPFAYFYVISIPGVIHS